MDYLRRVGDQYAREQYYRDWGPGPDKVSWEELCKRESVAHPMEAKRISSHSPIFMSRQLRTLISNGRYNPHGDNTKILAALRPEDAIHIPQLRVDKFTGVITDWNRSMCDLTGISRAQVVGKKYGDVLDEFVPNLTNEYKRAASDWLMNAVVNDTSDEYDEEVCREDHLFPLPLPLKYDGSFEYVSSGRKRPFCDYIELLTARLDDLPELYPKIYSVDGVPQYGVNKETNTLGWYFDTAGWVGGMEFTLRRKQSVPSLRTLCRELLPGDAFREDGSLISSRALATAALASKRSNDEAAKPSSREPSIAASAFKLKDLYSGSYDTSYGPSRQEKDVYKYIARYIRTCDGHGLRYIREVLLTVRRVNGSLKVNNKIFSFSRDWSTHPSTAEIYKYVLRALGGTEVISEKVVDGKKMTWTLAFVGGNKGKKMSSWEKREMESKRIDFHQLWTKFRTYITPVVVENRHARSALCGASDTTPMLPSTTHSHRTVLTLKIDGHLRTEGSYKEEGFKASAMVQVPASLNFFQLHRAVCQTMSCGPYATRETHLWECENVATDSGHASCKNDGCLNVQIGEAYFVENGQREDYGHDNSLFNRGHAIRQRISRTGAYIDQQMPLFSEEEAWSGRMKKYEDVEKLYCCIHTTCIGSVFFETGAAALLQDGLVKYCTKWKVTCTRIDEYDGPLPISPDINVMQPTCLRGKPEDTDDGSWSVDKANKQLWRDRGCLRRNLLPSCSEYAYISQMPFCSSSECSINRMHYDKKPDIPYPVAAQVTGLDHHPMIICGEPPLPGSDEYTTYVSTLHGRIPPKFLAENVMGFMGGFTVPFRYGKPGCIGKDGNYDSDDSTYNNYSPGDDCIGRVWQKEVDEEMKRMDSLQPKKKKPKRKTGKKEESSSVKVEYTFTSNVIGRLPKLHQYSDFQLNPFLPKQKVVDEEMEIIDSLQQNKKMKNKGGRQQV